MAWTTASPVPATKLKSAPSIFTGNWETFANFVAEEHKSTLVTGSAFGQHEPGNCGVVYVGPASALTAQYVAVPSGSIGLVEDTTSGTAGTYYMMACTASGAAATSGSWGNVTVSHLWLNDLTCGDPHTMYCCAASDTMASGYSVTLTGQYNYISAAPAGVAGSGCSGSVVVCGSIHLSGNPQTSTEVATKVYADDTMSGDMRRPRWRSATHAYVAFDSGLVPLISSQNGEMTFTHGIGAEPDITMLYLYTKLQEDGPVLYHTPAMHMHGYNFGPMITKITSTAIDVVAEDNTVRMVDFGGTNRYAYSTEIRVIGISKPPGFDSGWVALPGVGSGEVTPYTSVAHTLGVVPDLMTLEICSGSAGTQDRGYCMGGNYQYSGGSCWGINGVNDDIIYFTQSNSRVAQYYNINGTAVSLTSSADWWYRVKAWDWEPDYTSSWTWVDHADRRQVLLKHNLGQIPYLYVIEFELEAENTTFRSGHTTYSYTYIMAPCLKSDVYTHGTVASWNDRYVTILVGSGSIAYIYSLTNTSSKVGHSTVPSAYDHGKIRVKAWCT